MICSFLADSPLQKQNLQIENLPETRRIIKQAAHHHGCKFRRARIVRQGQHVFFVRIKMGFDHFRREIRVEKAGAGLDGLGHNEPPS